MILTAIEAILMGDGLLTSLVGLDENGFPKIYSSVTARPEKEEPPFVTFQIVLGPPPAGTYGDGQSLQQISFQVSSWGRNSREAWTVDTAAVEALMAGDWATYLLPDNFMRLSLNTTPGELPDRDTTWRQVPRTWNLDIERG